MSRRQNRVLLVQYDNLSRQYHHWFPADQETIKILTNFAKKHAPDCVLYDESDQYGTEFGEPNNSYDTADHYELIHKELKSESELEGIIKF